MAEKIVMTQSPDATASLFGTYDRNIRKVESAFDVRISNRGTDTSSGDAILVSGDKESVNKAVSVLTAEMEF